ncbi:hypothetical protein KUV80_09090 [Fictibacillus nanhaiensis]|uniref:hypothetical protein n=1 Tax=Fictibacillus nanhaiensis TaxID=742169 RepID=UPI001C942E59|nr:hypothetical protein [Fictibacillus nanhaiensis]MBY6036808.1 hypothetical protein [Fictibacillus nanhaiensis]
MKRTLLVVPILFIGLSACSFMEDTNQENMDTDQTKSQSEVIRMIANDEKIIEMLKKSGEIPEGASQEEINKALQKYLQKKAPGNFQDEKEKLKYINELKENIQKNSSNQE